MPRHNDSKKARLRQGVTLIELLVVIAIIAVVLAVALPAVQQAREGARRLGCRNNLKQMGLAVHNYVEVNGKFPQCYGANQFGSVREPDSWSIHAKLLPFMEQSDSYQRIDFDFDWTDPNNQASGVPQTYFPMFSCPSDPMGATVHFSGPFEGYIYPTNYGFSYGSWLVYDPICRSGGCGCFMRNGNLGPANVSDGLSNTLCCAEVKTYQSCIINTRDPGRHPPQSASAVAQFANGALLQLGAAYDANEGHSEWCDGMVHQTGFTTTFTPNTVVPYTHTDGRLYDIDWNTRFEGTSPMQNTYAAVTSRSHHSGLVHVLLMDGSVRSIGNAIAAPVWQALGTRAGSDVTGGF